MDIEVTKFFLWKIDEKKLKMENVGGYLLVKIRHLDNWKLLWSQGEIQWFCFGFEKKQTHCNSSKIFENYTLKKKKVAHVFWKIKPIQPLSTTIINVF